MSGASRPFDLNALSGASRPFVLDAFKLCGDLHIDPGEECDDGDVRDMDGCSARCLLERGSCGDGMVQTLLNEQCEPGVPASLPCRDDCSYLLVACGDEKLDAGESCDAGGRNSDAPGAACRTDCSLQRCGDRIVDPVEACDDGNRVGGDGCSATCRSERGAADVLPATMLDLPFQSPAQRTAVLPCDVPSDCPAGSACRAGYCDAVPVAPPVGDTGPAAVAVIAAGGAAGWAWMRRRRSASV
jgi:cysteine-rich repeat protein